MLHKVAVAISHLRRKIDILVATSCVCLAILNEWSPVRDLDLVGINSVNGINLNVALLKVFGATFCGEMLLSMPSANGVSKESSSNLSSSSSSSSLFSILSSRSEALDKALQPAIYFCSLSSLESHITSPWGISGKSFLCIIDSIVVYLSQYPLTIGYNY